MLIPLTGTGRGPQVPRFSGKKIQSKSLLENKLSDVLNTHEFKLQQFHQDKKQSGGDCDNMNQEKHVTLCSAVPA